MINRPPPFKGLNIGIPIIIPIKGRAGVGVSLKQLGVSPLLTLPSTLPEFGLGFRVYGLGLFMGGL